MTSAFLRKVFANSIFGLISDNRKGDRFNRLLPALGRSGKKRGSVELEEDEDEDDNESNLAEVARMLMARRAGSQGYRGASFPGRSWTGLGIMG